MTEYIIKSNLTPGYDRNGEKLEEIVRCRDCESYQRGLYEHFTCEYLHQWAKPDDFCAWGERKEKKGSNHERKSDD